MKHSFLMILLIIFITGCSMKEEKKLNNLEDIMSKVYTYEIDQVEAEHNEQVNSWLTNARQSGEEGQYFSLYIGKDTNDYMYTYVYRKGYSDYEVSFIYNPKDSNHKGSINVTGLKDNSSKESFVKIKTINDLSILFVFSEETIEEKLKD